MIRRYKQIKCIKCEKIFWGKGFAFCGSCRIKTVDKICPFCKKKFNGKKITIYCSKECKIKSNIPKNLVRDGKITRFEIFTRDNFKCIYCGRSPIEDGVKLHVDHIKSINCGGKSTVDNLITSCSECNTAKQDTPLSTDIIDRIHTKIGL